MPRKNREAAAAVARFALALALAGTVATSAAGATPGGATPGDATPGIVIHAAPPAAGMPAGDGSAARPFQNLAQAVAVAAALSARAPAGEGATVRLAPGEYLLTPHHETEATCGNCADPATPVPFTLGLRLSGRRITLEGPIEGESVIRTRAGYGILVQDCEECALRRLTITDGARDTSGLATDAAVVVQRSSVVIEHCRISGNLGDPAVIGTTIVGIIGVAGREDASIRLRNNRIERNSWDGVALYRDARAEITGNVVDGIDLALGRAAGGGRGVGIGLTWNAEAEIRGNLVRRYWKGIGLFVDARATVEENVVESVATWGLSLWDAGQGRPRGFFRHNAVDSTGACGAMISRGDPVAPGTEEGLRDRRVPGWTLPPGADPGSPGWLSENLFSRTGQNPKYDSGEPYCEQTAVARHAVPPPFRVEGNLFVANREPEDRPGEPDLPEEEFRQRARPILQRLEAWPALRESRFLRRVRQGVQ